MFAHLHTIYEAHSFFKKQGPNVLTIVVMFMTALVLFKIMGVDFNPKSDKHITNVVTIESMFPDDTRYRVNVSG